MSILEDELAQIIGDALVDADVPYEMMVPRTYVEDEKPEGWPSWEPWEPEVTTVEHSFLGFIDTYSEFLVASGVVNEGDVKIVLIQNRMPFRPELTDVIVARGLTYTILGMSEDPAKATLELRARA